MASHRLFCHQLSTVKIIFPLHRVWSEQQILFFIWWKTYLWISRYIYCHLADSPINPQHSGEGRTERNNGCFYTLASKQQLACISCHIGPMFLPRWSTPGVCGPPKSRDEHPHQFHIIVLFVQKCSLSPLFLSLFMCDPFSVLEDDTESVCIVFWNETFSFCVLPLLGIVLYFLFNGVILCIKPFCPF